MHGCEESISLTLPPLSVVYLRCRRKKPRKKHPADAAMEEKLGKPPARRRAPKGEGAPGKKPADKKAKG